MLIEASRLRAGEDSNEDFLVVAAVAAGESEGAASSSFENCTAAAGGAGYSGDAGAGFYSALDSPAGSAVLGAALCCASAAASSFGSSAAGAGDGSRCVRALRRARLWSRALQPDPTGRVGYRIVGFGSGLTNYECRVFVGFKNYIIIIKYIIKLFRP